MNYLGNKKLSILCILDILKKYSDSNHLISQAEIVKRLYSDYGMECERKSISANIDNLIDYGFEIEKTKAGCYLAEREFEDSELQLLIDGVLASKHIAPKHSKELINKLCGLSNVYFKRYVKNIFSVDDWDKTENQSLFLNIEIIDEAIEQGKQVEFEYNKYQADKKLHRSSVQVCSPYQFILHNQKYYLISFNEKFKQFFCCRVDRITNAKILDEKATDIHKVKGFENGIDYKRFATAMPYMFTDDPQTVEFLAEEQILDQVVDWFGKEISIVKQDDGRYRVKVFVSPNAMHIWSLQYARFIEVIIPVDLRNRIIDELSSTLGRYSK